MPDSVWTSEEVVPSSNPDSQGSSLDDATLLTLVGLGAGKADVRAQGSVEVFDAEDLTVYTGEICSQKLNWVGNVDCCTHVCVQLSTLS